MNSEDGQVNTLFVYCNYLVLLSTTVCSQNYKQTKCKHSRRNSYRLYSFLGRYHYAKSKNHLKRRYRIRHWIPMFIGTHCKITISRNFSFDKIEKSTSLIIGFDTTYDFKTYVYHDPLKKKKNYHDPFKIQT